MQSTSKTFDSTRQEALRADVRRAGELVASSSGAKPEPPSPAATASGPLAPRSGQRVRERGRPCRALPPSRSPSPRRPSRWRCARRRAPAAPPAIQIPFAPPPEDDAATPRDTQAGVEKKFAANDTLGAVLAREGFGAGRPERDRRARQAGRPAQHPRRRRSTSCAPATTARRKRSSTSPRRRSATSSSATTTTRPRPPLDGAQAGSDRRDQDRRGGRHRRVVALRVGAEGRRVDRAGQPAGRAVRLGRQLLHRHAPRRSLEGVDREAVPGRAVLQVRPRAGGRVRRQGRHLPRLLLGRQGRPARSPGQVLRRPGPGAVEEHAEDAAALRAHQLEVRSQALPPDPARRARAPRASTTPRRSARRSGRRPAGASSRPG